MGQGGLAGQALEEQKQVFYLGLVKSIGLSNCVMPQLRDDEEDFLDDLAGTWPVLAKKGVWPIFGGMEPLWPVFGGMGPVLASFGWNGAIFGQFWVEWGHFWPEWDHFWPEWDHFWPLRSVKVAKSCV